MPIHSGSENGKCFFQWGSKGAKYYYECGHDTARENAKKKAIAQGVAAGGNKSEFNKIQTIIDYINLSKNGKNII